MSVGSGAAIAARWSELWATDYTAMVRKIYTPDIIVEHAGHRTVVGRDALLAAEVELEAAIGDHRTTIGRVLDDPPTVVIEAVITGTSPRDVGPQACPACVWFALDGNGQVAHEVAFYEWSKRRPDDGSAGGSLMSGDGATRSAERYATVATRMAELWSSDPVRMVDELYADDTIVERLGEGTEAIMYGKVSLREAERELLTLLPVPDRRLTVEEVAGEADVVAIRFTIEGRWRGSGPLRRGPGAIVLTLDGDDRIVSDRIYWHWDRAVPVDG